MLKRRSFIAPATAAIALLVLTTPAAVSAQAEIRSTRTASIVDPITPEDLKRAFSARYFGTKAEVTELRAQMATLRARLDALKVETAELKRRLGMPPTTPPASTTP